MSDLTAEQKIGLLFALTLGVTILVISIITAWTVSRNPLTRPELKLGAGETQESKANEIKNYKDLTDAMHSRATGAFDLVVIKTLLPVFTTILAAVLAFVFVRRAADILNKYLDKRTPTEQPPR
jgi:hypothetical protein